MLNIEEIVGLENTLLPIIEKIKSYKAYALYGLGAELTGRYNDYVSHLGKPICIIDKKADGGNFHGEITILNTLEKAIQNYGDDFCVIIATPVFAIEIRDICLKLLPAEKIFNPLNGIFDINYPQFLRENKERIVDFYNKLQDDLSKTTFENWLRFRITADPKYVEITCIPNNRHNIELITYEKEIFLRNKPGIVYYPTDIITFNDEVLFDCGAYIGDNVEDFASLAEFKKIYAFELDKKTYASLCENTKKYLNVVAVNCGIWNKRETINVISSHLESNSISSNIGDEKDGESVILDTIDYLAEKYEMPTYIKMDIEGAELNALKGAEQTIKNHKPKLAVCLYHKPEDIFEIPEYLHSLRPDYKFFVRHYSVDSSELVLFAV
jgi:FkbM family methyltransferase